MGVRGNEKIEMLYFRHRIIEILKSNNHNIDAPEIDIEFEKRTKGFSFSVLSKNFEDAVNFYFDIINNPTKI